MPTRGANRTDVLVLGAGAIGLACAWRAAQAGLSVRVIDRDVPGAGASGVAAGMLAPVGEATWGEERLLAAALASHASWPGFAAGLGEASRSGPFYAPLGALHVAFDRDEAAELRRRFELMRSLELDAEWLAPGAARRHEPGLSPSLTAAVHAPHEAAVDPAGLVAALVCACEALGVDVVAGKEAAGLTRDSERVNGARFTDGSEVLATTTVLACGAWARSVAGRELELPVRPVKGQILTLRGPVGTAPSARIVVSERVYLVPRDDGRLIAGASVEEEGFDTRVTAGAVHELLREAYRALPDVAELELEGAVVGFRPGTPDNAPIVGRGGVEGLLLATGHYRNGILLCPITAEAIVAELTGDAPPAELSAVADPSRFSRQEALR